MAKAKEVLGDPHRRRLYDLAEGNLAEYEAAALEWQREEQRREQQRADEAAVVKARAEQKRQREAEGVMLARLRRGDPLHHLGEFFC